MNHSEERLREMLQRRAERVESGLTIADIRDTGMRSHRHRSQLLAPALIAAVVAVVIVVISFTGRQSTPTTPPAGPGLGNSSVSHAPHGTSIPSPSPSTGPSTSTSTTTTTTTSATNSAPTPESSTQEPSTSTPAGRAEPTSTVRASR